MQYPSKGLDEGRPELDVEAAWKAMQANFEYGITPFQLARCYSCFSPSVSGKMVTQTAPDNTVIMSQVELYCDTCWHWAVTIFKALAPYWGKREDAPSHEDVLDGHYHRKKETMN